MPLETIVRAFTEYDSALVPYYIAPNSNGKPDVEGTMFLYGAEYTKDIPRSYPLTGRTFFEQVSIKELVYEGKISGKLYLTRVFEKSTATKRHFSEQEDNRYRLFGSRYLYKAFFHLLNSANNRGEVSDKQYMEIVGLISRIEKKIVVRLLNSNIIRRLFSRKITQIFKEELVANALAKEYLERAQSGVKY